MKTKALHWHLHQARLWAVIMLLLSLTWALSSNVFRSAATCGWTTSGMESRVSSDTAPGARTFESAARSDLQAGVPTISEP